MTQSKLALDSYSELKLLTDIWNIEELVEQDKKKKALKAIQELIQEIRYSEIIDTYTLFDPMDEMRKEDLLDTIASTIRNTPNDMELGGEIRKLFSV
jgi:hypothetical protein